MVEVRSRVNTLKRRLRVARMSFGEPRGFCDSRLDFNEFSRFSNI